MKTRFLLPLPALQPHTRSLVLVPKVCMLLFLFCLMGLQSSCTKKDSPIDRSTLVLGRGGDSVGLDPAFEADGESFKVADNVFNTLVQYAPGSTELIADLATRWEVSADGLRYDFYLREGVQFHDGTPMDADAVLFSFNRQRDPHHPAHKFGKSFQYWANMSMSSIVKDIVKISDSQVAFLLHKPEAPFLANLGMNFAAIVSPTAVMKLKEEFARNPVGTGPFRFKRWVKGQLVELEANPQYYGGKPALERLIFKSIPDNSARLLEFLSGKIDVIDYPNSSDIAKIESDPRFKVLKAPGMNVGYMALNMTKKPLDQLKVRQAINHAINKKAIVDKLYEGFGMVATNPIPPNMWGYHGELAPIAYDPEKAKTLLKEAGFPDGFDLEIYTLPVARPYMPNGEKVAEAIQSDLGKVGIRAKLVKYEWGTYLDKLGEGEHQAALIGWSGDNGDPDNFLYILLDKTATVKPANNYAFYKSDELHEVLVQAKRVSDVSARSALYRKAQEIIYRDSPWVAIAHSIEVLPMKKEIEGLIIDPTSKRRFEQVKWQ